MTMYSPCDDPKRAGFPHSDIRGSMLARNSPQLFAACHVLHRLLAPRHSPNALQRLISDHPSQPDFFPQTRPTALRLLEAAFADVTSIHDRQSAIFTRSAPAMNKTCRRMPHSAKTGAEQKNPLHNVKQTTGTETRRRRRKHPSQTKIPLDDRSFCPLPLRCLRG
jgi:hypothetical protein